MAISIQVGTVQKVAATSYSVPLPADVVAGDLLLLAVENTGNFTATATGYTEIWTDNVAVDRFRLLKKTAGSSESAPTVNSDGAGDVVAYIIRVREVDTTTGPAQITGQASTTTTASIDPPTAGSVKIGFVHCDPIDTTPRTCAWTAATEIAEDQTVGQAFLSVAYKLEDTAGALAFTFGGGGAQTPGTVILSIAPGAAPAAAFVPQIAIT